MLKHVAAHLFAIFVHLGGFGLLILGVLDSSFLVMPLGNDLLIVGMASRKHTLMPYYVAMATAGSVLGCLLIDFISRKGGEASIEKHVPAKRLDYVRSRVTKSAGWALAVASLMPPPFPFTLFVIAAAALEYPRKKLLSVIAVFRFIRFSIAGILAILFGKAILRFADAPGVQIAILALAGLCIIASVVSVVGWIRRSARSAGPEGRAPRDQEPAPARRQ